MSLHSKIWLESFSLVCFSVYMAEVRSKSFIYIGKSQKKSKSVEYLPRHSWSGQRFYLFIFQRIYLNGFQIILMYGIFLIKSPPVWSKALLNEKTIVLFRFKFLHIGQKALAADFVKKLLSEASCWSKWTIQSLGQRFRVRKPAHHPDPSYPRCGPDLGLMADKPPSGQLSLQLLLHLRLPCRSAL